MVDVSGVNNLELIVEDGGDSMKLDRIVKRELFKVAPRWLFLKLMTEQGLVGWGNEGVMAALGSDFDYYESLENDRT